MKVIRLRVQAIDDQASTSAGHLRAPDTPGLGVEPTWEELGGPIGEYRL